MNTKTGKIGIRLGALLLSLCLLVGLLPTTTFAQDTGTTIFGYEGSGTWSMASRGSVRLHRSDKLRFI